MEKQYKLIIRVSWWMQLIQIIFALPFTLVSIYMLYSIIRGSTGLLFVCILFGCFAYFGWANALSTIQITDENVTVSVFYGRFRIIWDEVENIAMNNPFVALMGNNKRVVISLAFAGKNREKVLELFNQQSEQRNISFEKESEPFPITHQNARVWW